MTPIPSTLRHGALILAMAAALAACGGGANDSASSGVTAFVAQIPATGAASDRKQILVNQGPVYATATPAATLDWAQRQFPDLFSVRVQTYESVQYDGKTFYARVYSGPAGLRYLGVTTDGRVYGMGDFTGNNLQQFETLTYWSPQVCAVYPASCSGGGSTEPTGPFNGCTLSAEALLRTGARGRASFVMTGARTGQFNTTIFVDGPATFEGQSVIKSTQTVSGTQTEDNVTSSLDLTTKDYAVAAANGFTSEIGNETIISSSGFSFTTKVVYNPASKNAEFGISVGQSFTKLQTFTSTTSPIGGSQSSSSSTTYEYQARESISVQGKTYDTCRYRETTANSSSVTTNWYIYGKGVPARSVDVETTTSGATKTTTTDLVSGDIDGVPL